VVAYGELLWDILPNDTVLIVYIAIMSRQSIFVILFELNADR
ncbi:unnamed protein product, partial [marine sediment metagenome]